MCNVYICLSSLPASVSSSSIFFTNRAAKFTLRCAATRLLLVFLVLSSSRDVRIHSTYSYLGYTCIVRVSKLNSSTPKRKICANLILIQIYVYTTVSCSKLNRKFFFEIIMFVRAIYLYLSEYLLVLFWAGCESCL